MRDIIVAGVGGQGTVLAAKLIASAALAQGSFVRTAETIGMAQRGGSVLAHVRMVTGGRFCCHLFDAPTGSQAGNETGKGDNRNVPLSPLSPLIPPNGASLLIGFEPAETVRALPYLQHGGTVVTARHAIKPPSATLDGSDYNGSEQLAYLARCAHDGRIGELVTLDGETICRHCGSTRVLNVALLGAAAGSGALGFSAAELTQALETLVKARFVALNKRALTLGMQAGSAADTLEAHTTSDRYGRQ